MLVTEEEASGSEPVWHLCPGNQQGSEVFLVAINLAAWVLGTGSYFLPHSEGGSEKQVMGPHPRGWKMGWSIIRESSRVLEMCFGWERIGFGVLQALGFSWDVPVRTKLSSLGSRECLCAVGQKGQVLLLWVWYQLDSWIRSSPFLKALERKFLNDTWWPPCQPCQTLRGREDHGGTEAEYKGPWRPQFISPCWSVCLLPPHLKGEVRNPLRAHSLTSSLKLPLKANFLYGKRKWSWHTLTWELSQMASFWCLPKLLN